MDASDGRAAEAHLLTGLTGVGYRSPVLEVRLLGKFGVSIQGQALPASVWRRRASRQLFKCLLSRPQRRLLRDEAFELFWPDSEPEAASTNLRSAVHTLRKALGAAWPDLGELILVDRDGIAVRAGSALWVDADAFEDVLARAEEASDPLPFLEQADALYVGEYLPDDLYDEWATERRERLKRSWTELQRARARVHRERGNAERAREALDRLLQVEPMDENATRELMRLHVEAGRPAEALRAYARLKQALDSELGIEPSPETTELYEQFGDAQREETRPPASGEPHGLPRMPCTYPFPNPARVVGRASEIAGLEKLLARGQSRGAALVISGPAGTGKSTLAGELVRQAERNGVMCLAGAGYQQEGIGLLGPFHDAVASYVLARPPEQLRIELGAVADDLTYLVPELRYHLGSVDSAADASGRTIDRSRLFGAVHVFLRALARHRPLLLCVEDLHAADAASIQLFSYLARQVVQPSHGQPVLIVGTHRSEGTSVSQRLGGELAALEHDHAIQMVNLSALDRAGTAQLASSRLEGPCSEQLIGWLFDTSEGNPLFVEQLVLALREDGRLLRQDGRWRVLEDAATDFPRIVQELIRKRVERVAPRCRETLAVAAVLGQTFDYDVLLNVLHPRDETSILEDLSEAIDLQFLHEVASGFMFTHELVRTVIYQGLSTPRRMLLHARAAVELENLSVSRKADYVPQLAHHFSLAGHAPAVRAKALSYSLDAGRRASALSAYAEALQHFSRAGQLIQHQGVQAAPGELLEALEGRGRAERALARWPEAISTFGEVLEHCDDPVRRSAAHGMIAYVHLLLGHVDEAVARCELGLSELEGGDSLEATNARLYLQQLVAHVWYLQGRYRDMAELGSSMLVEAGRFDEPLMTIVARSVRSWGCMGMGQAIEALEQTGLLLASAEAAGEKVQLAIAHENLGFQLYLAGHTADARRHLEASLSLYRDVATDSRAINAVQHMGLVLTAEGALQQAKNDLLRAIVLQTGGDGRFAGDGPHFLGSIQVLECDWEGARANFEKALRIRQRLGDRAGSLESICGLAFVQQHTANWQEAAELFDQAVLVADQLDPSPTAVMAHRSRGRLRLQRGETTAATDDLQIASTLLETMPETRQFWPTVLARAELCASQGAFDEAIQLAEGIPAVACSAEHRLEALIFLAHLSVARSEPRLAARYAAEAVELAERMRTPRLLALGRLASAQAAAARDSRTATSIFEAAMAEAELARAPYELALVKRALAEHVAADPRAAGKSAALKAEADAVLTGARAQAPVARSDQAANRGAAPDSR